MTSTNEKTLDPELRATTLDDQPLERDASPDASHEKPKDDAVKDGVDKEGKENNGSIRDYFVSVLSIERLSRRR